MSKEDLIGTTWKCPWPGCNYEVIITEDNMVHYGNKHYEDLSLDILLTFEKYKQVMREIERKYMYE